MIVNFNDANSVRAWLAVHPALHRAQLRTLWRLWPQFRDTIYAAVQHLDASC